VKQTNIHRRKHNLLGGGNDTAKYMNGSSAAIRTNMVATLSGKVLAMMAKLEVSSAAAPTASAKRTRKHMTA